MGEIPAGSFEARPHRTFLGLAAPVALTLIAEPLVGLVDTAFVARLGAAPLAGLGAGTALLSAALWIFNFLAVGTQTEVSRSLGASDSARAGAQAIEALVPLATMFGYVNNLRSMTQGRATYTMQFSKYAEVPDKVSASLVYR